MAMFFVQRVRGALLIGILTTAAAAWLLGLVEFQGVVDAPPTVAPTFLQLDIVGAFRPEMITVVFVFFFLALFDSVGTLVGVAEQAGLMRNDTLPRARGALMSYALLKLATGRGREAHWLVHVFAVLFVVRYLALV